MTKTGYSDLSEEARDALGRLYAASMQAYQEGLGLRQRLIFMRHDQHLSLTPERGREIVDITSRMRVEELKRTVFDGLIKVAGYEPPRVDPRPTMAYPVYRG
jgi:hypothetical protein